MSGIQVDEGDDSDFEKNSNVRLKAKDRSIGQSGKKERAGSDNKNSRGELAKQNRIGSAGSKDSYSRVKKDVTGTLAKYDEQDQQNQGGGSTIIKRNNNFVDDKPDRSAS